MQNPQSQEILNEEEQSYEQDEPSMLHKRKRSEMEDEDDNREEIMDQETSDSPVPFDISKRFSDPNDRPKKKAKRVSDVLLKIGMRSKTTSQSDSKSRSGEAEEASQADEDNEIDDNELEEAVDRLLGSDIISGIGRQKSDSGRQRNQQRQQQQQQQGNGQPANPQDAFFALTVHEMKEKMMVKEFLKYKDWFRAEYNHKENWDKNPPQRGEPSRRDIIEMRQRQKDCFFCSWGKINHDSVDGAKVKVLYVLLGELYGQVPEENFAIVIKKYYDKEIYEPMMRDHKRITKVEEVDVIMHMKYHMLDPRVFISETIEKVNTIIEVVSNKIMMSLGPNDNLDFKNLMVDLRLLKALDTLIKLRIWLHDKPTEKMAFLSPLNMDLTTKKSLVSILKNFKINTRS